MVIICSTCTNYMPLHALCCIYPFAGNFVVLISPRCSTTFWLISDFVTKCLQQLQLKSAEVCTRWDSFALCTCSRINKTCRDNYVFMSLYAQTKYTLYTLEYDRGKTHNSEWHDICTHSIKRTCVNHSSPGRVSNVGYQKIVEHSPSIVSTEHVNPVVPDNDGVLATAGANKLLTTGHLFPEMKWFGGRKVERQIGFCRYADARHVRGASARGRLRHTVGLDGLLRLKKWLFASV